MLKGFMRRHPQVPYRSFNSNFLVSGFDKMIDKNDEIYYMDETGIKLTLLNLVESIQKKGRDK